MTTFMQKKAEVERKWYVIDANDIALGRVATKAAHILRGKHKVTYTPHVDCGDYVIIVNASKVKLTGNKLNDKLYYNHSGYTGGLRVRNAKTMRRLGRAMYKKLFVYAGPEHKHQAQMPTEIKVD